MASTTYAQGVGGTSGVSGQTGTPASPSRLVEADRMENGILYFRTSSGQPPVPLQTHLDDASLLGELHPLLGGQPYFLLTGKTCKDCLADTGMFILSPQGGKPYGYMLPGQILDAKTRAKVYESRGFFGHCLPSRKHDVLVIFQRENVDKKHGILSSVLIAEPALEHEGGLHQDHLHETLLEAHLPRLTDTLKLVKKQGCHEITGRNRVMLNKPLDIEIRNAKKMRDEDREQEEKEKDEEDSDGE